MDKAFFETSMFLEPFRKKERETGNYSRKALAILNGLAKLQCVRVVSASVLAECSLLLSDPVQANRYNKSVQEIKEIHHNILKEFIKTGIKREAIILAAYILREDGRLGPFDVLNFACAVAEGCKFFFFIDKEIKNSQILRRISKEHGISLVPFDIEENLD